MMNKAKNECLIFFFYPLPITWALQYKYLRVINETVGNRGGNGCAVKNISPIGKRQICGNHSRFFYMPLTDDLEEQIRALCAQRQLTDLVGNEQIR